MRATLYRDPADALRAIAPEPRGDSTGVLWVLSRTRRRWTFGFHRQIRTSRSACSRRDALGVSLPTVVFAGGSPSLLDDRISDDVLDLRPGLLIVVGSA